MKHVTVAWTALIYNNEPNNVLEAFATTEKKAVLELADTSSCVKIASAVPCCKLVASYLAR